MKKVYTVLVIMAISLAIAKSVMAQTTTTIFYDDFNGSIMNSNLWHIPTWVSSNDGTFVGRTQFRCTQNASLPAVSNSQAIINLETFNPTGFSLYGTDLISNRKFAPGDGLIFTIHAKITSTQGGIVGGIFLYDTTTTGLHDEIDFELVTNQQNYVHTNVYSDQPLGVGTPDSSIIVNPITTDHIYVIKWLSDSVSWYVDGNFVRKSINLVPDGSMHLHINMWAPAIDWPSAYNSGLQPTSNSSANQIFSMVVDSVRVDSLTNSSVGLSSEESKPELNFYPNPTQDIIYFNTPEKKADVRIYNILGKLLISRKEVTINMSVNGLSSGLYLIKYRQNNVEYVKKLIIHK